MCVQNSALNILAAFFAFENYIDAKHENTGISWLLELKALYRLYKRPIQANAKKNAKCEMKVL